MKVTRLFDLSHLVAKFARAAVGAAALWSVNCAALAASAPDAGRTLQQLEKAPLVLPDDLLDEVNIEAIWDEPNLDLASSIRIPVTAIQVRGSTKFSSETLGDIVAPAAGNQVTLEELREYADRITDLYVEHGFFLARAYIPRQEVVDGIVLIEVVEARYDRISVKPDSVLHISAVAASIRGTSSGQHIHRPELVRSVLLLDDTPGFDAAAVLRPGYMPGTANLDIDLAENEYPAAELFLDNYGDKYTGRYRLGAAYRWDNPSGVGDRVSIRAVSSGPRLNFGDLRYLTRDLRDGLRFDAALSRAGYRLGREFRSLDAHGTATSASLGGRYPLIRSYTRNVYIGGTVHGSKLRDRIDAVGSDVNKSVKGLSLSISADSIDHIGASAVTSGSVTYERATLNIEDPDARSFDAATARTRGAFHKLNLDLLRVQRLSKELSVRGSVRSQWASKNLDSSRKFVLGGPYGVRAYAEGEASGDSGYLLSAEVRYRIPSPPSWRGQTTALGFVDTGSVRRVKQPWQTYTGESAVSLTGVGLGVLWNRGDRWAASVTVARPMGSKPASASGRGARVWAELRRRF